MSGIGKIGKLLMFNEPFYGLYLLTLNKAFSTSLPTAGVGLNGINQMLYINPTFWDTLSEDHKIGLLKHELLHICFFHLTTRHAFGNAKLFNIAADLEINQYIESKYLPDGGITMASFPSLTLNLKAGTKYYYEQLSANLKSDSPDEGLMEMMAGQSGEGDIHPTWKEFDQLSDSEKKLIINQVEHTLKETANNIGKLQGKIPGELSVKIDDLLTIKEPVFNWRAYLRRTLGISSEVYTKKSRRKESKRFVDSAGLKIKQRHHILVGIDTSGSVSNEELLEFFSELFHMYKAGTKVTIIECDTKINDKYEYNGTFKGSVKGRGGTLFDPVVDYYNDNKDKYTVLVYFTDGGATLYSKPLKKMLWVISSNGSKNDSLIGQVIEIKK